MRLMKKMVLIFFVTVLAFWLVSIAKCEIYTMIYSSDFENAVVDDITLGSNLKVLRYTNEYAEVYYKGDNYYLATYIRRNGKWDKASLRVIRDSENSVSKLFIWPYFWDYFV